jgi:hypothetical protein
MAVAIDKISRLPLEKALMKELKKQPKRERPKRAKVTREEALERMKSFPKRTEKFIAAIRKGTHRDLHS